MWDSKKGKDESDVLITINAESGTTGERKLFSKGKYNEPQGIIISAEVDRLGR